MGMLSFTEYVLPHGDRRQTTLPIPDELDQKCKQIRLAGYVFECEVLRIDYVSFTIGSPKDEVDLACKVCFNGPEVLATVQALINEFDFDAAAKMIERNAEEGPTDDNAGPVVDKS